MEELMVLYSVAVFEDALCTYFHLICLRGIFWHFTTQDNFEEFADVDEIDKSLSLDKIEALKNLDAVPIVALAIIVKEKVPS
jgi:hypothetical protein